MIPTVSSKLSMMVAIYEDYTYRFGSSPLQDHIIKNLSSQYDIPFDTLQSTFRTYKVFKEIPDCREHPIQRAAWNSEEDKRIQELFNAAGKKGNDILWRYISQQLGGTHSPRACEERARSLDFASRLTQEQQLSIQKTIEDCYQTASSLSQKHVQAISVNIGIPFKSLYSYLGLCGCTQRSIAWSAEEASMLLHLAGEHSEQWEVIAKEMTKIFEAQRRPHSYRKKFQLLKELESVTSALPFKDVLQAAVTLMKIKSDRCLQ